jgi:hypothetical protein
MTQSKGYLFVDHRASPGIPEQQARQMGLEPSLVGEGKVMEADTLFCAHCNAPVILNPLRTRARAYCMACAGRYICDLCNAERLRPDYKHLPFREIVDLVATGEATAVRLGVRPLLVSTRKREL